MLFEPSATTVVAVVTAAPFALGALIVALSSYPDSLNRAAPWADDEAIDDELTARGLVASEGGRGGPKAVDLV